MSGEDGVLRREGWLKAGRNATIHASALALEEGRVDERGRGRELEPKGGLNAEEEEEVVQQLNLRRVEQPPLQHPTLARTTFY